MSASLSTETEAALEACGRDRVFHNDGTPPMVAIRWGDGTEASWIVGKAEGSSEGHDAAGRKAAVEFVKRLRLSANGILEQANRIEVWLAKGRP